MLIADVENIVEAWSPRWIAWERDTVGLQVGDRNRKVSKVLVALDVTEEVISEAAAAKADLIVSHHPVLFRPPKTITADDPVGRLVLLLAERKIALYSAHTNLDFTKEGVSVVLARTLGLEKVAFLSPLKNLLAKIVVFVPERDVERVMKAMANAGAGVIGEYSFCSFRTNGKGSFRGSDLSNPTTGKAGRLELVDEIRLEMTLPRARVPVVVQAMKQAHSYEEVAYDVYVLENTSANYGDGAIGELRRPLSLSAFLRMTKRKLGAEGLRYTGDLKRRIKTVAVCGGSGAELIPEAMRAKADVFVTADIRYHTFHSVGTNMALVDAGHWETENVVLHALANHLRAGARNLKQRLKVDITRHSTNVVHNL